MKTALFVDFDNIYLGLKRVDPLAAEMFATQPSRWLSWLESGLPGQGEPGQPPQAGNGRRNTLVRKCYLNPATFHLYRNYFTCSAFEVIDCPPLTNPGKNSSDIRMVIDILDSLEHPTRFDEFIILSGDADFTPVLLRLRAYDRRTMVLTIGSAAVAYKSACDEVLTEHVFIKEALVTAVPPDTLPAMPPGGEDLASSHSAPGTIERRVQQLTGTPPFTQRQYALFFMIVADVLRQGPSYLTNTSREVRSRLAANNEHFSHEAVTFIMRGSAYTDSPWPKAEQDKSALKLAQEFTRTVVKLCHHAQLELLAEDLTRIESWITGGLMVLQDSKPGV